MFFTQRTFKSYFSIQNGKNSESLFSRLSEASDSDKGVISIDKPRPYPWPAHAYADFYSMLLVPLRMNAKRVSSVGLAQIIQILVLRMSASGTPGTSLRVWKDYFPNAHVFWRRYRFECSFSRGPNWYLLFRAQGRGFYWIFFGRMEVIPDLIQLLTTNFEHLKWQYRLLKSLTHDSTTRVSTW